MSNSQAKKFSGGCLCESIRYEISFGGEGAWPPMVATCQCTLCRKWSGGLVSNDLIIKRTQISPALSEFTTLQYYESTPGTQRGFCSKCGSGLFWLQRGMAEEMVVLVGTIDEQDLMGSIEETTVQETEHGKEFQRQAGHAQALCETNAGNLYWQNAIKGVTDNFPGPRFLQSFTNAPLS